MVCWNAARPIRAWASRGAEDAPDNVAWSRKGNLLAFTAGDMLYVWQPTAEAGEPELPGDKPEAGRTGSATAAERD
ncbi:MAG: hypothetical protein V1809_12505 [Planctomycetota bacterium]